MSLLLEESNTSAVIDHYAPESIGYDAVADPTDSSINRLQLTYAKDDITAVLGRQRIIFDNARFIGNVGWRQQEQVYDAVRLGYKLENVNTQYVFINKVHTPGFAQDRKSTRLNSS